MSRLFGDPETPQAQRHNSRSVMRVLSNDDDDPPTSPLFEHAHAPIHQHRQSPHREEAPPVPLIPDALPLFTCVDFVDFKCYGTLR